jgi:predicted ATPase
MIERIRFNNFRVLRDAEIRLGPFNVVVGPNGSGKSTLFQAIEATGSPEKLGFARIVSAGSNAEEVSVEVFPQKRLALGDRFKFSWKGVGRQVQGSVGTGLVFSGSAPPPEFVTVLKSKVFALDPAKLAEAIPIQREVELQRNGANLVAVLDQLRDRNEEVFDALRADLKRWIPEYDNILFDTPETGKRSFKLRQTVSQQAISAVDLSEGTILALSLLTIAHGLKPPKVICLEEPDRALHPRLLRELQDALYRLAFPDQFELKRDPVQVIVTTHSPHFLNLFKDHPEQIIIAEKRADGTASFKSLAEDSELREMIGGAPLGDVWYSGILGGVPAAH